MVQGLGFWVQGLGHMARSGLRVANRTQPALAPRKTVMLIGHCRQQGTAFDTGTSVDFI